jgi:sugar phosphate isomerase/epimerase
MSRFASSQPNRREFLAASLGTAGALALGARAALGDPREDAPYGPFRMGLQSYSLRGFKTEEALAKTKDLGLHFWESYSAHTKPDPAKAADSKALAASFGVEITGFGVSSFTKNHDANRRLFEFGKALGVEYLSADPDRDAFGSLEKLVEEYGIAIGIHPHGPGAKWATIDEIHAAIKDLNPKIGICIDAGHLLRAGDDPVRAVEVFSNRTYGVHLKDVKNRETYTKLGEGDLRLGAFLQALKKINYKYCLALEYEENPANPIADIRQCLDVVKAAVANLKTA